MLIIDNSVAVRQRLLELISVSNGKARVWQAADAPAALTLVRGQPLDVALVDLSLGGHSGLDLIAQLRAEQAQMVIVVLTNCSTSAHRQECLRRGANFFFDKSHDFEAAIAVVAEASSVATAQA